jgi:hypothetical protein
MKEPDQSEPKQPSPQPDRRKPGPVEETFSLAPLTFLEAVTRAARFKRKMTPKKKPKRNKPS